MHCAHCRSNVHTLLTMRQGSLTICNQKVEIIMVFNGFEDEDFVGSVGSVGYTGLLRRSDQNNWVTGADMRGYERI